MSSASEFLEIYQKYVLRDGAVPFYEWLVGSDFFTAPASTKYHGAHAGGLCEHSINVFDEIVRLLKAYPEIKTTGETAAIISLLHDVCKIGCYKTEMRNAKENGAWVQKPYYTFNEDFSYGGHGSKSVFLIERFMRLTEEEAVAINCHMSSWDAVPHDWSISNAYQKYPLAWLLHVADESASFIKEAKNANVELQP